MPACQLNQLWCSQWPCKDTMHKHALHLCLSLPVQQLHACICAFFCDEACCFCSSLQIFYSEEVTHCAIQAPVQPLRESLLRPQPEMCQVVQAMIPDQQLSTRLQCLHSDVRRDSTDDNCVLHVTSCSQLRLSLSVTYHNRIAG